MIKLEDEDLENFVLGGQSCIAVPIEVYVPTCGSAEITAYRTCREIAEEFERNFEDGYLSDEALRWLDDKLSAFERNTPYKRFHGDGELMLEYSVASVSQLNKMPKNDKCIMISDNETLSKLCENTCCDIEIDGGDDVIFAVVEDGKILSYAGVNDLDFGGKALEISVETDPDEMRKGYGSACVTSLCAFLLSRGYEVLYKCSTSNIASAALAEKCGFKLLGKRYSCTFECN